MVNKCHGCTGREQLSHSLTTATASNIFTWFNYTGPGYDRVQRCVTFAPPRNHSKLKCLTNRITFLNRGYPIRTHQETIFGMHAGKRRGMFTWQCGAWFLTESTIFSVMDAKLLVSVLWLFHFLAIVFAGKKQIRLCRDCLMLDSSPKILQFVAKCYSRRERCFSTQPTHQL